MNTQVIQLEDFTSLIKERWVQHQYTEARGSWFDFNSHNDFDLWGEVGLVTLISELRGLSITYRQQYDFTEFNVKALTLTKPLAGELEFDFNFLVKDGDIILPRDDVIALVKPVNQFTNIDKWKIL